MQLEDVRRNYDKAAKHYDAWLHFAFERFFRLQTLKELAIDRLGSINGARVLDIGCGTGSAFPLLLERVGPTGEIVGIDYSEGMLSEARRRAEANGWANVALVQGDAATLCGVDGTFQAVISCWAMGIVHDLPAALNKAVEVLEPAGRMAILDFHKTKPDTGIHRLMSPLYHKFLLAAGFDEPEDLNDERLGRKWAVGKDFLHQSLLGVEEETYFHEVGFVLYGSKPTNA